MQHALKGLIAVILVAGLLWLGWSQYREFLEQGQRPTESTQVLNKLEKEGVPPFSLDDLKGQPIALSDYKDKVVIVNFWASWCNPCVEEFPSMIKLIEEFDGEVILLAVSADNSEDEIKAFLKAFDVESPYIKVLWDKNQQVAKKFGTVALPESYILGANNRLIRKISGIEDWASPDAIEFFKDLIKHEKGLSSEEASDQSS